MRMHLKNILFEKKFNKQTNTNGSFSPAATKICRKILNLKQFDASFCFIRCLIVNILQIKMKNTLQKTVCQN